MVVQGLMVLSIDGRWRSDCFNMIFTKIFKVSDIIGDMILRLFAPLSSNTICLSNYICVLVFPFINNPL